MPTRDRPGAAARAPRGHGRAAPRHPDRTGAGGGDCRAVQRGVSRPCCCSTAGAMRRCCTARTVAEERPPALQRPPGVPQDRPHAGKLPPLRLQFQRVPRVARTAVTSTSRLIGRGRTRLKNSSPPCWLRRGPMAARWCASRASTPTAPAPRAGSERELLAQVHAGEIDVLVGTQMIAKGRDFRRITLVAAVNPDGALFSPDFARRSAPFALLRRPPVALVAEARLRPGDAPPRCGQTYHPDHPLFEALRRHDYPAFAHRDCRAPRCRAAAPSATRPLLRRSPQPGSRASLLECCTGAGRDPA